MVGGKSPSLSHVTVERIDKEGTLFICWESETDDLSVKVYVGDSPTTIKRRSPAASLKGANCTEIGGLDPDARYYFAVKPEGGDGIVTAERQVPIEGVVNFRDLGGYETVDGRRVKWGQVFRSGHLARITEKGRTQIRRLGLKLICDFRTPGEVEMQPDWLPEDGSMEYLQFPIVHGEFDPVAAMERIQKGDLSWLTEDFIVQRYIKKIDDFADVWGAFFSRLAESQSRPLLFHCTAGKDRAGAAAALILLALGVPEETVVYDHGLSNIYIADVLKLINARIKEMGIDPEKAAPYFTAPRNAITALIDHIRTVYGSAADYLETQAGFGRKKLARLKQELLD